MISFYIYGRLASIALDSDPSFSTQNLAGYAVNDSALEFGTHRILTYLGNTQSYDLFFIPSCVAGIASFQHKLDGHKAMLEGMQAFDIRASECC